VWAIKGMDGDGDGIGTRVGEGACMGSLFVLVGGVEWIWM